MRIAVCNIILAIKKSGYKALFRLHIAYMDYDDLHCGPYSVTCMSK